MRGPSCLIVLLIAAVASIAAQDQPRPNLLLVTIDALRADRVTETLTPSVMALAARGARFERAYAHTPLTLPSHASILTGLLPPSHGVRNNGFRLDDTVLTVAELLSQAGYRTAAFVGSSPLDARFGLSQGFDEYDDRYDTPPAQGDGAAFRYGARPASAVVAAAAAWAAGQSQPWFMWTHLRDPHASPDAYDRGVASADAALGDLLAAPAIRSALDRTVIVVTADHGESLGEHGERTHGVFAYEGAMRVPLVIAGPGVASRTIGTPAVSHVDLAPTMLDLLGVGGRAFDGQSLIPILEGSPVDAPPIYFEALDAALMRGGAPLTGVVIDRWKYIDLPIPELYDVVADPEEKNNLAAADVARATRMRDATVARRTRAPRADAAAPLAEPEARARLRSLGYVGSASWRLGASRIEDDPKKLLPQHSAYEAALAKGRTDPDGAIVQLRSIVEARPGFAAAIDALASLLLTRDRAREAIALLTRARGEGLRHRVLAERLAAALLTVKDPRAAVAVLEPVVESDGTAADARFLLARALVASGRSLDAIPHLQAALEIDPTFPAASDLLARLQKR